MHEQKIMEQEDVGTKDISTKAWRNKGIDNQKNEEANDGGTKR